MAKIKLFFNFLVPALLLAILPSPVSLIVTFPSDGGVYSLFPHEDLKTGRRLRFPGVHNSLESRGGGVGKPAKLTNQFPNSINDLYSKALREEMIKPRSKVYFDNERLSRFKLYTPRIRITPHPHDPFDHLTSGPTPPSDRFVPSLHPERYLNINLKKNHVINVKLPPEGDPGFTRFHIFDPESKSFNLSPTPSPNFEKGHFASARKSNPKLNLKEPGSNSFIDHEKYLEYHTKKALDELTKKEEDASIMGEVMGNLRDEEKSGGEEDNELEQEFGNDRETALEDDKDEYKKKKKKLGDNEFKASKSQGALDAFNPPVSYSKHLGSIEDDPQSATVKGNVQKLVKSAIGIGKIDKITLPQKETTGAFIPYKPSQFARGFLGSASSKDENGIEFGTEGNISDELSSRARSHQQQQIEILKRFPPSSFASFEKNSNRKSGDSKEKLRTATSTTLLRPYYAEETTQSTEAEQIYTGDASIETSTSTNSIRENELPTDRYHSIKSNQFASRTGSPSDPESLTTKHAMITLSPYGYFTTEPTDGYTNWPSRSTPRIKKVEIPSERGPGKKITKKGRVPTTVAPTSLIFLESSESVVTSMSGGSNGSDIIRVMRVKQSSKGALNGEDTAKKTQSLMSVMQHIDLANTEFSLESSSSSQTGVVAKVHAHISKCPKLYEPAEIICDVHIREGHKDPSPQLTVGWRRKYYNETKPDVLLALNKTLNAYSKSSSKTSSEDFVAGNDRESSEKIEMEDFHDKFNVTLAPGISPMLRSVLLIRRTLSTDTGAYECNVFDGEKNMKSDTLLFLCL